MSAKRALIVDDSRSARSFLARILEKYDIAVDTAETAEVAIEYLARARPDVIFMDHMMPGMDGFQAVQLIKNNPATATIPIMMYTSQEGELYLGQARALGAMGVLPKQIKPAEVSTVLHQLRLVPDRRQGRQSAFTPANDVAIEVTQSDAPVLSPAPPSEPPAATATAPAAGAALDPAALSELRHHFEAQLRTELGDLRRSISASLDLQSERLLADVRAAVTELNPPPPPPPVIEPPPPPRAPWFIAAAASIGAAVFAVLWWQEAQQTQRLAAALVEQGLARGAPAGPAAAAAGPAASGGAIPAAAAAPDAAPQAAAATETAADPASAPPVDKIVQPVPYGEVPLSGERLEALRALLRELVSQGFRGLVTVSSHPGRFCLAGNLTEGYSVAPAGTPLGDCAVLGNPFDEGLTMAQRQPLSIVNLIGTLRRDSGGLLNVQLAVGSENQRAAPYPADSPQLTAGDWNRAAEANNRVEIRLRPAS